MFDRLKEVFVAKSNEFDPMQVWEWGKNYLAWLRKIGFRMVLVTVLVGLALFVALFMSPPVGKTIGAVCIPLATALSLIWYLLASPLILASRRLAKLFPEFAEDVRSLMAGALEIPIWGILIMKFWLLTPIWQNPGAGLLILGCFGLSIARKILSASSSNPVWAAWWQSIQLGLVYLLGFLSLYAPMTMARIEASIPRIDRGFASQVMPTKRIEINDPATYTWFDETNDGAPLVWYALMADGSYHFYASEGFYGQTGQKLTPVTMGIVEQLKTARLLKQKAELAEQEMREVERQAKEDASKRRLEAERQETLKRESERRAKEVAEAKRMADAAETKRIEDLRRNYLDILPQAPRAQGQKRYALIASSSAIEEQITSEFANNRLDGVELASGLFSAQARELTSLDALPGKISELGLSEWCDGIIEIRHTASFTYSLVASETILKCDLAVTIAIRSAEGSRRNEGQLVISGTGLGQTEAQSNAAAKLGKLATTSILHLVR